MSKNFSEEAAENLAKGVNEMHNGGSNEKQSFIALVKRQAEEIDRRGQIIMNLEESLQKLELQNKHLQSMIDTMRSEREKLIEELESKQKAATPKRVTKKSKQDATGELPLS